MTENSRIKIIKIINISTNIYSQVVAAVIRFEAAIAG
jgi:hypothetical protein